jgi:hypothetical protein
MTGKQFTRATARLGIAQARLARLLCVHRNTPGRWARDEMPVPEAVALLLTAWTAHPNLIPDGE